jgi:hypothetical protein
MTKAWDIDAKEYAELGTERFAGEAIADWGDITINADGKPEWDEYPDPVEDTEYQTWTAATAKEVVKICRRMGLDKECYSLRHEQLQWIVKADRTARWETIEELDAYDF